MRTPKIPQKRSLLVTLGLGVLSAVLTFGFQNCSTQAPATNDMNAYGDINTEGDAAYRLPPNFNQQYGNSVTCQVSTSASNLPIGSSMSYTIAVTGNLPAGFKVHHFGSKNGIADASEVSPVTTTSLTETVSNDGYSAGTYIRYFQVRDSLGRTLCQTNAVQVTLEGPVCLLSASAATFKVGDALTLTNTLGPGTTRPAGAIMQWMGTNNGLNITAEDYAQTDLNRWTRQVVATDAGSTYIRRLVIFNSDGSLFCSTNSVRFQVTQ